MLCFFGAFLPKKDSIDDTNGPITHSTQRNILLSQEPSGSFFFAKNAVWRIGSQNTSVSVS
jgi:fructose-1-phosphate kinase PfkB-like protein